jgi:hypothetical protein
LIGHGTGCQVVMDLVNNRGQFSIFLSIKANGW